MVSIDICDVLWYNIHGSIRRTDLGRCIEFTEAYFTHGEYTHTLRLISKLIDLRVGYAKRS